MPTTKKQLTVKPEFNDFLQAVDEYTAQLPLVIRMSFRQALHSEYEGDYGKVEELCRGMLASHPENTEVLALLGRAQLSQQKYKEAEETLRDVLEKEPIATDNPLGKFYDSNRLIITPHMAWASVEARERCVAGVYENIKNFLDGKPSNIVNP